MNTAQIAERVIRRHRGETLTLVLKGKEPACGSFHISRQGTTRLVRDEWGWWCNLGDILEVFPGSLTRQQIRDFYAEHGVPQEARYA
jgi:hypothetical protein